MTSKKSGYFKDLEGILSTQVDLSNRFCTRPFERFQIQHGNGPHNEGYGDVFVCCPSMVPFSIGNYQTQSLDDIWNSSDAQKIRKSILDGSFSYCRKELCPRIQGNFLPKIDELPSKYKMFYEGQVTSVDSKPSSLFLCYDRSCNLSCPSCRKNMILHNQGSVYEQNQRLTEKIIEDFFSIPHNFPISVCITGSGDPFASKVFRYFLSQVKAVDFPKMQIDLYTNGTLLNSKAWEGLSHLHSAIRSIVVSLDAATPETYKKVRGGNWDQLLDNLHFIGQLKEAKQLKSFETNYVVQTANYVEIPAFIELSKKLKADKAAFCLIMDWGTWDNKSFFDQCVWKKEHPQFNHFLQVLKHPLLQDPIVRAGSLTQYIFANTELEVRDEGA